jgi:proteasome lid subunit RPN8/RPN11
MEVQIEDSLLKEMLKFARSRHPFEVILLLRGEKKNNLIRVSEYLFPPFASASKTNASFPVSMLPVDFTIIGTAHSHPSGSIRLSNADYHNFFGRIMLLMVYPYRTSDVVAFTKNGERAPIKIF